MLVSTNGISDITWIPFDYLHIRHLFRFVMFFQFFLDLLFCELFKFHNIPHKFFIIKLVAEWLIIRESRIDSENNRQFLFHSGPELFKLIFRETKLKFIILSKNFIIFWNGGNAPLLMNLFMSVLVLVVAISWSFTHLVKLLYKRNLFYLFIIYHNTFYIKSFYKLISSQQLMF